MEANDKSLLRCTIKKSVDVAKKIGKYAAGTALGILAAVLVIYGAIGIWTIAADPAYKYLTAIVSFLFSIPWYCYAGIVAIAAIPVYSLLWCVARELTEEDWESNEAAYLALTALVALALALALASLALASLPLALAFLALALALALASLATDTKAFLFIGAYLHYRKRVKAE
jgi:uncharacterized membrane protein